MEKIVVLTDNAEKDNNLVKCLGMIFPECEIEVRSKQREIKGDPVINERSADTVVIDTIDDNFITGLF